MAGMPVSRKPPAPTDDNIDAGSTRPPTVRAVVAAPVHKAMEVAMAGSEVTFEVFVSGNAAARYEASCHVETGAGTRTVELSGAPPLEAQLQGQAIHCEVTQTADGGELTLALQSSTGNVSRLSTSGPGSVINLSVD